MSTRSRHLLGSALVALSVTLVLSALPLIVPTQVSAQGRSRTRSSSTQRDRSRGRARSRSGRSTNRGRTRVRGRDRNRARPGRAASGRARSGRATSRRRAPRRRRRVRVRIRPGVRFDRGRCDYVERGYCVYYAYDDGYYDEGYGGGSTVGLGMSLGTLVGVFDGGNNGLWSPRLLSGADLDPGVLFPFGGDARLWLTIERFRVGLSFQGGGVPAGGSDWVQEGDAFEAGSSLGFGYWLGLYGIAAYQMHLDDVVQIWLGGRLGGHLLYLPVRANGHPYALVRREFLSGGPEIGVRLSAGEVGLMIWGFADLAQPGVAQLNASVVFEVPKPPGAAF